jgi:predicted DNA-binding helix-hairpin-helix protein
VNIELPSEDSLHLLAPQKKTQNIFGPMRQITETQAEHRTLSAPGFMGRLGAGMDPIRPPAPASFTAGDVPSVTRRGRYKERFAPAGQTTQMIIGASKENDLHIIRTSEALYRRFSMKRVYFSAYIPVSSAPELPDMTMPPPLKREHRLYQADWLLRFYGFRADEILSEDAPNLDYELDPKVVWALRHLEHFPIEINKASLEELLRIPGVGNTSATRIMRQRREAAVRYDDLKKMGVVLKRAKYFLTCSGRYYGDGELEPYYIHEKLTREARSYPNGAASSSSVSVPALTAPGAPDATGHVPDIHTRQAESILDGARIRNSLAGKDSGQISMFEALQV